MKKILAWLKARLTEPTTYAGLAVIGSLVAGPSVGATIGQVGTAVGMIVGGGLIATPKS